MSAPPTLNVVHAITALDASQILITFGHTRMMLSDTPEPGVAAAVSVIEWLQTLSMSPTAAVHLQQVLSDTLIRYGQKFGTIPVDKDLERRITEGQRSFVGPLQ